MGGACPEGYEQMAVAKGNWLACHGQKEDGTDLWSLAGLPVGEKGISGLVYTNDTTAKSREVVLQVISTLSFPSEFFSSDKLGLCFSYPQGYTQISADAVEIAAPNLPGSDVKGLFWLEIRDSKNRWCTGAAASGNPAIRRAVNGSTPTRSCCIMGSWLHRRGTAPTSSSRPRSTG